MSTSLTWRDVTIPDSSPSVKMARLREEADGSFWALVRFPAGWSRPVVGHYLSDEEFWLLEGELTISGVTYVPQQGDHIPAGRPRAESRSPKGALALARFGGPATWVRS